MGTTATAPGKPGKILMKALQTVVGLGLAVALVIWGIPVIGQTTWPEIFHQVGQISWWHLVVFFVLLMGSLWCYTFLITGSLPGITHTKALTVNLAATAVSNVLPAGGVMGIAATYMMCRSWRLPKKETSTSLVIAGVWNVLIRVAMPVVALTLLLATDRTGLPNYFVQFTTLLVVGGIALVGLFVAAIVWDRAAALVGELADRTLGRFRRRGGRDAGESYVVRMREWQHHTSEVVGSRWFEMTAGMSGFFFFLFILFWECMSAVGVEMTWQRMFVAFALNRLVTAFPITPGSMGVAELVGTLALAGLGADTARCMAGLVLFMICNTLAQIPLGGIAWLVWLLGPRAGKDDPELEPDAQVDLLRHPADVAAQVFATVEGGAGTAVVGVPPRRRSAFPEPHGSTRVRRPAPEPHGATAAATPGIPGTESDADDAYGDGSPTTTIG